MKTILFSVFTETKLAKKIAAACGFMLGNMILRQFPDGETYLKINSDIKNCEVILLATLDRPNEKLLSLIFTAVTAKELGAKKIGLIIPYLPYLRQDKIFNPGEALTSKHFAALIAPYFNWLITIDPHLHRYHSLNEIYKIKTTVLSATVPIAQWIQKHVDNPVLIGPDKESAQWVAAIAKLLQIPYVVAAKQRKDARTVSITLPDLSAFKNHTPVLADDIIATGKTMIENARELKKLHFKKPVCIGVHAIFSGNDSYAKLKSYAKKVVTCNTIKHPSNEIDITELIISSL